MPLKLTRAQLAERCANADCSSAVVRDDGDYVIVNANRIRPHSAPLIRTDEVSFLQKAKNFALATAKHVAAGMPMASDEEILRRHDICQTCEFFKNNSCSKCGCPVYRDKKFVSKLAWADQSCPVGKWGPQETAKGQ